MPPFPKRKRKRYLVDCKSNILRLISKKHLMSNKNVLHPNKRSHLLAHLSTKTIFTCVEDKQQQQSKDSMTTKCCVGQYSVTWNVSGKQLIYITLNSFGSTRIAEAMFNTHLCYMVKCEFHWKIFLCKTFITKLFFEKSLSLNRCELQPFSGFGV